MDPPPPKPRPAIQRTRTGCSTCRNRKVRICPSLWVSFLVCLTADLRRLNAMRRSLCALVVTRARGHASGRRRIIREQSCLEEPTLLHVMRARRRRYCTYPTILSYARCPNEFLQLRCVGNLRQPCEKCSRTGIDCVRSQPIAESSTPQSLQGQAEFLTSPSCISCSTSTDPLAMAAPTPRQPAPPLPSRERDFEPVILAQLPAREELNQLVQLYFSSVHRMSLQKILELSLD